MKPLFIINALFFSLALSFSALVIAEQTQTDYGELTSTEIELLQHRMQQQNSTIITTANPEQYRLLRSSSRMVNANAAYLNTLLSQMRTAMLAHEGTGLTAVQIGVPVRIILLQRNLNGIRQLQTFLNPEIISSSPQTASYWEHCLSLPNLPNHLTERPVRLTIRYQKTNGQTMIETLTLAEAAIFQQEMDHLNGVLLSDHHSSASYYRASLFD